MTEFLLEVYATRTDPRAVDEAARRARSAADSLASEGPDVRYVRSIFVPEDETCFYVYEAESAGTVREVARRAGLSVDRVVETRSAEAKGEEQWEASGLGCAVAPCSQWSPWLWLLEASRMRRSRTRQL